MSGKVLEIIKLVLIVLMSVTIIVLWKNNGELKSSYEAYKKDGTYVKTYQSQTIKELKKQNKELYDSIKDIKNVKQAVIIKYKYKYNGETIYVDRTLPIENNIYKFTKNTDTISYVLTVKSDTIDWYKLDFSLNDKLTLINREENGNNEVTINTSNGGSTIIGTEIFNKKENKNSFINRFSWGIQIGVGHGLIHKKTDVYVGVGASFRINKVK